MSAFSSVVKYELKPTAVNSRAYTSNINPSNGTSFTAGDVIRIDIPTGRRGTYLVNPMGYLQMTFNNNNGAGDGNLTPDDSGYGLIKKLEVYHGSNLLESVDSYNLLGTLLLDCQVAGNETQRTGTMTIGCGFSQASGSERKQANVDRLGTPVGEGASRQYNMPLFSGVIGGNLSKYLPLGALSGGGDLRVEITLDSTANACCREATKTGTEDYTITNVQYVASILELGAEAQDEVERENAGSYSMSTVSWRNYTANVDSAVGSASILVPARFASVKSLYCVHRPSANINSRDVRSISDRSKANMSSYQFRIGSLSMPQQAVDCADPAGQVIQELMKSFHQIGQTNAHTRLNETQFNNDAPTSDSGNTLDDEGSYAVGLDLESFSHRSDVIDSGTDSQGQNIFFEPVYSANTPAAQRVDSWAFYDLLLKVEDGIMSAHG